MSADRKAELETVVKACRILATVDVVLAVLLAAGGNSEFGLFMVLAGLIGWYGAWLQEKANEETGD